MTKTISIIASLLLLSLVLLTGGCDKERIVETTEYIEQIEYIEQTDTVFRVDTIVVNDSVPVGTTDTVHIYDTVSTVNTVYDTTYIHDTVNTVQYQYDTVTVTVNHYDTVTVTHWDTIQNTILQIDTVFTNQCSPNEYLAIEALQQYSNSLVMEFINAEFGYSDGWVFYLSTVQSDLTIQSSSVYDIYGFIDYWTPEWDAYYPLEYYWRMTYTGGDPADANSWQLAEPPAATAGNTQPGLKMTPPEKVSSRTIR